MLRHYVRGAMMRYLCLALLACTLAPTAANAAEPLATAKRRGQLSAGPLNYDQFVGEVMRQINEARVRSGLRPLRAHVRLMATAQQFSQVQAQLGRLTHRGTDQTNAGQRLKRAGYDWAFWGETIAGGYLVNEVVDAWLSSPSHRSILLSPKATEIGVGHTVVPRDSARYYDYWVVEVGRRRTVRVSMKR